MSSLVLPGLGLLYYFNFVQVPAMGEALADEGGPGPAAIGKYIAPRALLWFRMSAAATWITGAYALENVGGFVAAFMFAPGLQMIGLGAWLGTIMLFNVWVIIWPNQQKILGMKEASAEEIAKAKFTAAMASRTNVVLSVPMLLCMTGFGHGNSVLKVNYKLIKNRAKPGFLKPVRKVKPYKNNNIAKKEQIRSKKKVKQVNLFKKYH